MFVFGEVRVTVIDGQVRLPKEFNLENTTLYAAWSNSEILILADNIKTINYYCYKSKYYRIYIDANNKIEVPLRYDNYLVDIIGYITTIELKFIRKDKRIEFGT